MDRRHALLQRQLARAFGEAVPDVPEIRRFIDSVDEAYRSLDHERKLLERALELSSDELLSANDEIRGLLEREKSARKDAERLAHLSRLLAEITAGLTTSLDPSATIPPICELLADELSAECRVEVSGVGALSVCASRSGAADLADLAEWIARVPAPCTDSLHWNGADPLPEGPMGERLEASGSKGVIREPFRHGDVCHGVIVVVAEHPFEEDERVLVHSTAQRVALALENARLYRESELASTAKDEFLATLSHELRTPMTSILGWSRLLDEERDLDAETRSMAIGSISRSATVQAQLIDDLLDVSRILTGKLTLEPATVVLQDVVRAAVDTQGSLAAEKSVELALTMPEGPIFVRADAARLQQVVWNVLSNAIKFSQTGQRVEIDVASAGDEAVIEVRDHGEGIDPEILPFIFERFRQAAMSSKRNQTGLGLGLSIAQYLSALHGGRLEAESEGPGRGARFRLALPRLVEPEGEARPELEGRQGTTDHRLDEIRVLIVEDTRETLEFLKAVLVRAGANVETASSVAEARSCLDRSSPALILSDVAMPREDGFDFIAEIRRRELPVPVIALTAFGRPEDRARILEAGFAGHLVKPVAPRELVEAVAQTIRAVEARSDS